CWDIWGTYPSGNQSNPTGPASGSYRVIRGGSWYFDAYDCTVSSRGGGYATGTSDYIGFRVVRVSL
ncbi:MAG: SUMF1/EgtB/PvdO family nonheme iron enzyme, partial [Gammaproteobacteria bacterium]